MTVALATAANGQDVRPHWTDRHLPVAAAGLMALAAGVHVAVAPEHLRAWWPAGMFLLAVGVTQAWWALSLLRRRSPRIVLGSIWSTVAVVGLYAWSRTAGLPFVPVHHGADHAAIAGHVGHAVGGRGNGVPIFSQQPAPSSAEPVGALDLTALGSELAMIAVLLLLLPDRSRRHTGNALLACGVGLLVLRATVLR